MPCQYRHNGQTNVSVTSSRVPLLQEGARTLASLVVEAKQYLNPKACYWLPSQIFAHQLFLRRDRPSVSIALFSYGVKLRARLHHLFENSKLNRSHQGKSLMGHGAL